MSKANDTQVGGTHYKNSFEHWDLCHELDLGYFEGQITKYITRHRFKKGKEDADKALHFCKKLIELATYDGRFAKHRAVGFASMSRYATANQLTALEYACIMGVCNWRCVDDLVALQERIERLIEQCYPSYRALMPSDYPDDPLSDNCHDGAEPNASYLNQG